MTPNRDSFKETGDEWVHREASGSFIERGGYFPLGFLILGVVMSAMSNSGWPLLLFGGVGVFIFLAGAKSSSQAKVDLGSGTTKLSGRVTRTRHWEQIHEQGSDQFYSVTVGGREFRVKEDLYDWAQQDDEVVVTYYPRTGRVVEIARTRRAWLVQEGPLLTDRVCRALQEIGVDAHVSEHDVYGVIEIAEGPISRVIVRRYAFPDLQAQEKGIHCLVSDSREWPGCESEDLRIHSVRVKSVPVVGRVERVRWDALYEDTSPEKEFGSTVADRLMQDALITEALVLDDRDVAIDRCDDGWNLMPTADGNYERYISKWTGTPGLISVWNCYQAIAQHLLDTPIPSTK